MVPSNRRQTETVNQAQQRKHWNKCEHQIHPVTIDNSAEFCPFCCFNRSICVLIHAVKLHYQNKFTKCDKFSIFTINQHIDIERLQKWTRSVTQTPSVLSLTFLLLSGKIFLNSNSVVYNLYRIKSFLVADAIKPCAKHVTESNSDVFTQVWCTTCSNLFIKIP